MSNTFLIYSDGNYFPRAKKSGYGGYVQSPDGKILVEFTEQIKRPQYAYSFELLGIIRGLELALEMGCEHIKSHCDDKTTMQKLREVLDNGGDTSHLPAYAKPELYDEIVRLSKQFKSSEFHYISRTLNKHSDALSRRYAIVMEQNFLRHYENDLNTGQTALCFQEPIKNKRLFFSHPNLIRMKEKNNPFMVANLRNKKARKISKAEQLLDYQHIFIEIEPSVNGEDNILRAYYYERENKGVASPKELLMEKVAQGTTESMYCDFLNDTLHEVKNKKGLRPIWIYSNVTAINGVFEQKEKLHKDNLEHFRSVFQSFNAFERIMYHAHPFAHTFSPNLVQKEEKKAEVTKNIETVESLIEQLQQGALRDQNKYFGKIIRHQLRSYQEILKRELNEIEKKEVIQKTTSNLENLGFTNLPKLKI